MAVGGKVLSFSQRNAHVGNHGNVLSLEVPAQACPEYMPPGRAPPPPRHCPCLGLGSLESLLTPPPAGISWDGFRGARGIALPGSMAYARSHGVYLTDSEVGPWARGLCSLVLTPGWPGFEVFPMAAAPVLT